jgi:hypothetical protein
MLLRVARLDGRLTCAWGSGLMNIALIFSIATTKTDNTRVLQGSLRLSPAALVCCGREDDVDYSTDQAYRDKDGVGLGEQSPAW